jgi:transcription elongation GreA/GreB family factor
MSNPFTDRQVHKLELLEKQLAWVNAAICEFAQENDLEGQIEYLDLLNQREHIEQRMAQLSAQMNLDIEMGDLRQLHPRLEDPVTHGSIIRIRESSKGEYEAKVVSEPTVFSFGNHISADSPLGRAIIGKKPGEQVHVTTPAGVKQVEILAVLA